jgi:hypothetical protein
MAMLHSTLRASAAGTTGTITGSTFPYGRFRDGIVHCIASAKDVGATTLDLDIQTSHDGTNFVACVSFVQFTAVGNKYVQLPNSAGPYIRYVATLGGGPADTWTFAITLAANPVPQ